MAIKPASTATCQYWVFSNIERPREVIAALFNASNDFLRIRQLITWVINAVIMMEDTMVISKSQCRDLTPNIRKTLR